MTDTGFIFRASWPIRDKARTLLQLRVEACEHIDDLAREKNARIIGEIAWSIHHGRLIAQSSAEPIEAPAECAA